jgi:hypothetical protein
LFQVGFGGFLLLFGATEGVALLRQSPIKTGLCKGIVGFERKSTAKRASSGENSD